MFEDCDDEDCSRGTRVVLPSFEGGDSLGWITKAKKFFEIQRVRPGEKMQLTFISTRGVVANWFRFLWKKELNLSWERFILALMQHFGGKGVGNVFERRATLCQTGIKG